MRSLYRGWIAVLILAAGAIAQPIQGETPFFAILDGEQETPPVETAATGTASGVLDVENGRFEIQALHDVENFTVSHLHVGAPGVGGPIVFDLGDTESPIEAVWEDMTDEEIQELQAGLYYVNIHSQEYPPGEIRGQLFPNQALLEFEGEGPETGITTPGASDFYFAGSWWSGGIVGTVGVQPLYASGLYHYQAQDGAHVAFEEPVEEVSFFFVHDEDYGVAPGEAIAHDVEGEVVATAASNEATVFNDPDNFVHWAFDTPVERVEFTGGVLDDFSYRFAPFTEPGPGLERADVNNDGEVNAQDIQLVINEVLGLDIPQDADPDINCDGVVNAQDIQLVINAVLGLPIGPFPHCVE